MDNDNGTDWLAKIEEVLALADEVSYQQHAHAKAVRFAADVTRAITSIRQRLGDTGLPTENQQRAILNWERGLKKWLR